MLAKPAISELTVEPATLDLLNEYLEQYFDGTPHAVGANAPVPFPQCELRFQQSPLEQPMSKPCIALVWTAPASVERRWETVGGTRQQMAYTRVRLVFLVRATAPANSQGNAKKLCIEVASKLAGLLGNSAATKPLAQKGIQRLRPGLPQSVENAQYVLRRLEVAATLRYPVLSQV